MKFPIYDRSRKHMRVRGNAMHSSAEAVLAERGREFWRGVLVAGGLTAIPGGPAIRSRA